MLCAIDRTCSHRPSHVGIEAPRRLHTGMSLLTDLDATTAMCHPTTASLCFVGLSRPTLLHFASAIQAWQPYHPCTPHHSYCMEAVSGLVTDKGRWQTSCSHFPFSHPFGRPLCVGVCLCVCTYVAHKLHALAHQHAET